MQACVTRMQTNGKKGWHDDFSPEVHVFANTLVPVVSTAHLVVRRLIGITRQAHTSGTARTYLKSEGSSMTRSTRVALHDPRGVSTTPLTNPPLEPLDATLQCNHTRITHSLDRMITIKQEWVRALPSTTTQATKALLCSATGPSERS